MRVARVEVVDRGELLGPRLDLGPAAPRRPLAHRRAASAPTHARISIAARGTWSSSGASVEVEQQLEPTVPAPVPHPRRAALADRDQPGLLQPLQRLADRVPARRQLLAEAPLGRQRLTGRVASVEDVGPQAGVDPSRKADTGWTSHSNWLYQS